VSIPDEGRFETFREVDPKLFQSQEPLLEKGQFHHCLKEPLKLGVFITSLRAWLKLTQPKAYEHGGSFPRRFLPAKNPTPAEAHVFAKLGAKKQREATRVALGTSHEAKRPNRKEGGETQGEATRAG